MNILFSWDIFAVSSWNFIECKCFSCIDRDFNFVIYLKRQHNKEFSKGKKKEREIFCRLVHSPNDGNYSGTRLKPEAGNTISSPMWEIHHVISLLKAGAQIHLGHHLLSSRPIWREPQQKQSDQDLNEHVLWDANAISSGFSCCAITLDLIFHFWMSVWTFKSDWGKGQVPGLAVKVLANHIYQKLGWALRREEWRKID